MQGPRCDVMCRLQATQAVRQAAAARQCVTSHGLLAVQYLQVLRPRQVVRGLIPRLGHLAHHCTACW